MNAREASAQIIGRWLADGDFPDRMISANLPDRAFVRELVYGAVKQKRLLEWVIERFSRSKPDADILPHLLSGTYQIMFMNSPSYASVHETVEAAKKFIAARKIGYLNSVLRRVSENRNTLLKASESLSLGVRTSHPDTLIRRWTVESGADNTARLCEWNNSSAGVTIRPMLSRISMPDFMERLAKADTAAIPHPSAPETFLILPHGCNITTLPGYDDGLFTVQDPSTAISVSLLNVKPGMTVLDACAAPGGKTALIGDSMKNTGRIVAMDIHEDRLAVLRENFRRLQLKCVDIVNGDASCGKDIKKAAPPEGYDRILLDVPCSNTGVLQRRPDARWRWNQQRIATLTAQQYAILSTASAFLKPGGILVYSTCSIEPEENANLVRAWLASTNKFTMQVEKSTFPPDSQTDGIYAAAIQSCS